MSQLLFLTSQYDKNISAEAGCVRLRFMVWAVVLESRGAMAQTTLCIGQKSGFLQSRGSTM